MFAPRKALAVAGLLLLSIAARAGEVLTLTSGEWQPYISEKSPHYGPISRIVTEAFALEGVQVNYVFRPWSRAYVEAANGSANGTIVWSASKRDTDRRRDFYVSDVVLEGQSVLFHLKTFQWHGKSLAGVRMGGTAGYEYVFDKDPRIVMDRTAATDELNFRKLAAGRFDVFPANLDVGRHIMRDYLEPEQAAQISWDPKPYNITRYHLLLSKKDPAGRRYLALFNKGLKRLRESGKYAEYLQALK
ncbi:substrate-binding periplasmic protein [Duganella sp. CT11-25]|uniref:substrate-binding periplasmic protein n=1 Tax=unclassified Duganella TaxID=2636909 RepID=UPI0039B0653A